MTAFPTFADLAAFLMLYISRVDGSAHYLEETTLAGQLKEFTGDSDELLRRITVSYPQIQDEKIESVLIANAQQIRSASPEQRKKLVESLFAIVNSDGRVQTEETAALRVIRGALEDGKA